MRSAHIYGSGVIIIIIINQRFKEALRDIHRSASATALSSVQEIKQALSSMRQELTTVSPAVKLKRDEFISELEAELGSKQTELRAIQEMFEECFCVPNSTVAG